MSTSESFPELPADIWEVEGRLVDASNVALRMAAAPPSECDDTTQRAVYKPVDGERPLADFPLGSLAHREVAAWIVAEAGGWTCIPPTQWYEGEFGAGSLQRWVGPLQPEEQDVVDLIDPKALDSSEGWIPIAAFESDDGPVLLAHADDQRLRSIAALDVVLANADRKGSHIIVDGDQLYAIDNGLSFHTEDKLRTVLWGWAGEPLGDDITEHLERLVAAGSRLDLALAPHLDNAEIEKLHERVADLLDRGVFPDPPRTDTACPGRPCEGVRLSG